MSKLEPTRISSDLTATERLCRMLDERGVEWWCGEDERKTHWRSDGLTWEYFNDENGDAWLGFLGACESDVTPEQAIAATLGTGECHDKGNIERFICSECGCRLDLQDDDWEATMWLADGAAMAPRFCPNCGRKVEDA